MTTIGVSLKMYFGHDRALAWFLEVADRLRARGGIGATEFVVFPTFLQLVPARGVLRDLGVHIGAQDVAAELSGAFTGEVSAAEVAEVGGTWAEIGHAERRRLFGETDEVVAAKTAAALRAGLTPLICVGEVTRDADAAPATVVAQLRSALADAPSGRVGVAYEPHWAIGAPEPATPDHIARVCAALRSALDDLGRPDSVVLYGGSAGPGLLTELGDAVDGLFLGRFAHDPANLLAVLDEARAR